MRISDEYLSQFVEHGVIVPEGAIGLAADLVHQLILDLVDARKGLREVHRRVSDGEHLKTCPAADGLIDLARFDECYCIENVIEALGIE